MNRAKLKTAVSTVLTGASLVLLSACGGSSVVSASAVATCAHAEHERYKSIPPHEPSYSEVVAKVVSGGRLVKGYTAQTEAEQHAGTPGLELYVFPSNKTAEEAFNIISAAPNAKEEWGSGGTFRRENVIANGDQASGSLTTVAETLLNKCAGPGASQSVIRPSEEVIDGHSRSQIERAGQDGDVLPDTTGGETVAPTETTQEPAQEPPASEDRTNPGQSPVPGGE
jgi:hypothetical protein